jgi:hypothetical protein
LIRRFSNGGDHSRITRSIIIELRSNEKKTLDENSRGERIDTELYQVLCYRAKLTFLDLDIMTIGNCLDYIEEYYEQQKPAKERVVKASQAHFDSF